MWKRMATCECAHCIQCKRVLKTMHSDDAYWLSEKQLALGNFTPIAFVLFEQRVPCSEKLSIFACFSPNLFSILFALANFRRAGAGAPARKFIIQLASLTSVRLYNSPHLSLRVMQGFSMLNGTSCETRRCRVFDSP